jgi:hypothetical protein
MALTYSNYRWERSNVRKGDRFYYKRDAVTVWKTGERSKPQEQLIATVTYDADSKSPYWGKWHVNFGAQSPEIHRLRMEEVPKFGNKDDAMAWATAMIRLSV